MSDIDNLSYQLDPVNNIPNAPRLGQSRVTVYTQPGCQPCKATIRKLNDLDVPHRVLDADNHRDHLAWLGATQTPVVTVENTRGNHAVQWWQGYRPEQLKTLKESQK